MTKTTGLNRVQFNRFEERLKAEATKRIEAAHAKHTRVEERRLNSEEKAQALLDGKYTLNREEIERFIRDRKGSYGLHYLNLMKFDDERDWEGDSAAIKAEQDAIRAEVQTVLDRAIFGDAEWALEALDAFSKGAPIPS